MVDEKSVNGAYKQGKVRREAEQIASSRVARWRSVQHPVFR